MELQTAQGFCGKTKERAAGRIKMHSRDFSPVLTQKNALNVFPAKIVLLSKRCGGTEQSNCTLLYLFSLSEILCRLKVPVEDRALRLDNLPNRPDRIGLWTDHDNAQIQQQHHCLLNCRTNNTIFPAKQWTLNFARLRKDARG